MNEEWGRGEITASARNGAAAAFCHLSVLHKLFLSLERAAMLRQSCLCEGMKKQPLGKEKLEMLKLSPSAQRGKVGRELGKAMSRTPDFDAVEESWQPRAARQGWDKTS